MRLQCPYCGVGCGLRVESSAKGLSVRGDVEHPASRGAVCIKPLYLCHIFDKGRIAGPMFREDPDSPYRKIDWQEACSIIARRLGSLRSEETYFYLSGQLLTEEIYVINKFVKGFLRTNNMDANTRLCMASSISAFRRAFGTEQVFGSYGDIEDTDTFLFVGSNAAIAHPVLFNRILKERIKRNITVITIDPFYTETAAKSDVFIPLEAGTDTVLFNAILSVLHKEGHIDKDHIRKHTLGLADALGCAHARSVDEACRICGVSREDIEFLAHLFARSRKLITFWCQGINQSSNGTMKNHSIINLHLATGRLDRKRGFPFPLTGQSNATGGRLMGYLSHGLPGYRMVSDAGDRSFMERFWRVEGIEDVAGPTIIEAMERMARGSIRFLWVVGTNPAVSLPEQSSTRRALERVFLVVQDPYFNDTARYANMLLPAAQVGEKDGTMISGDRTITLCNGIATPYGEARSDWEIFVEVARKMGWRDSFAFGSAEDVFAELRQTTRGTACDFSSVDYRMLPFRIEDGGCRENRGRAVFVPAISSTTARQKGFVLITGRMKRHWHTMTKTGKSMALMKDEPPPYVVMNHQDALELGVSEWERVRISSRTGSITRVVFIGRIRRRHVFTPFGYPEEFGTPVNRLVYTKVDPLSGQPELKYTLVEVEKTPPQEL